MARGGTRRERVRGSSNGMSLPTLVIAMLLVAPAYGQEAGAAVEPKPAPPVIPDRTFNLNDFGGVGDGKTLNTEAFGKALAKVEESGGGRLVVPPGTYRTL